MIDNLIIKILVISRYKLKVLVSKIFGVISKRVAVSENFGLKTRIINN